VKMTEPTKSEFVGPPPEETGPGMPVPMLFSRDAIVLIPSPVNQVMSTDGSGPIVARCKGEGHCRSACRELEKPGSRTANSGGEHDMSVYFDDGAIVHALTGGVQQHIGGAGRQSEIL